MRGGFSAPRLFYLRLLNSAAVIIPRRRIAADAPRRMYSVELSVCPFALKPEKLLGVELLRSEDEREEDGLSDVDSVLSDEDFTEPSVPVVSVED